MSISVAFSGSESISSTEHSMTTDTAGPDVETSDGVFQLFLQLNNIAAGDELQVRIYEKVLSGSTQRIVYQQNLMGPFNTKTYVHAFPALVLMHGWDMTLDLIAGSAFTAYWSIRKVA
jgi:hypothetical protein